MLPISDIKNIQNEMLVVGSFYKNPDLFIEYENFIKSKYDFCDEATRFFYNIAKTVYLNRSHILNKSVINTFVTENTDRLSKFKKFGGIQTINSWTELVIEENFENYLNVLKKYSLLRELDNQGYNVEKIMQFDNFEDLSAQDILRIIKGSIDRINTQIFQNNDIEILNKDLANVVINCLSKPDMGIPMPYSTVNELFRGYKLGSMMAVGMLSNAGKSRFMFKMIADLALIKKEPVMVLLNEMSIPQMKYCLLTTVINNREFQDVIGISISKNERDITLGKYKDLNGEYIKRKTDSNGNFIESVEDFIQRLRETSQEFNDVMKISNWIDNETEGLIYAKDVSGSYDDRSLELEIKKANMINGINYFFYDTLKDDTSNMGEWVNLKITTTKLAELAKSLDIFIYASIQLTDDTNFIKPDELTSSNISNCKQLKYVLDYLILFKEVAKNEYTKYGYLGIDEDWGEPTVHELKEKERYYIGNVDKNRAGDKKKLLFRLNLNTNEWYEIGEVVKKF